jgi:hypothetical protein
MTTRTYLTSKPNIRLITNGLTSYKFLEGRGTKKKIKMFNFNGMDKSIVFDLGINNIDSKFISVIATGTGQLIEVNNLSIIFDENGINLYFRNKLDYTFKFNSSNINFISIIIPQINNRTSKLYVRVNDELHMSKMYVNESINSIIIGKTFNGYIGGFNYDDNQVEIINKEQFSTNDTSNIVNDFINDELKTIGIDTNLLPTTTPPMTTPPMTTPPMTTPPMTTPPMTTPPMTTIPTETQSYMTTPPMTTPPMTTIPIETQSYMTTIPTETQSYMTTIPTMTTPMMTTIPTETQSYMTTPMMTTQAPTTTTPWFTDVIEPTPSQPSQNYNPVVIKNNYPTTNYLEEHQSKKCQSCKILILNPSTEQTTNQPHVMMDEKFASINW